MQKRLKSNVFLSNSLIIHCCGDGYGGMIAANHGKWKWKGKTILTDGGVDEKMLKLWEGEDREYAKGKLQCGLIR